MLIDHSDCGWEDSVPFYFELDVLGHVKRPITVTFTLSDESGKEVFLFERKLRRVNEFSMRECFSLSEKPHGARIELAQEGEVIWTPEIAATVDFVKEPKLKLRSGVNANIHHHRYYDNNEGLLLHIQKVNRG